MTIMTVCPPDHQASFLSLGDESVRDFIFHVPLSFRGIRVLDRLLVLLPTHLYLQPTSRVSTFPPALLFSICDALRNGQVDNILPSVLNKLRDWRLLDIEHRYSPEGVHKLALDLAAITDEVVDHVTPSNSKHHRTSRGRLRIKWVTSDLPHDKQGRELSPLIHPSPSRSGTLPLAHQCPHVLPDSDERRFDAAQCHAGRLGTPDPKDASVVTASRRRSSVAGFRSGCAACRHPRVSGSCTLPSPQTSSSFPTTPFSDVTQLDAIAEPAALPPNPKSTVQPAPKKAKRDKPRHGYASPRALIDENDPPPLSKQAKNPTKPIVTGISFPRQDTHSPRLPTTSLLFRGTPHVQRQQPCSRIARESDPRTSSHRATSIDLRLPLPMANRSRTQAGASPIDRHPTRTQSVSYTPVVAQEVGPAWTTQTPNTAVGSSRLPLWTRGHPWRHSTMTAGTTPTKTTTMADNAIFSSTPSPSPPPPPLRSALVKPTGLASPRIKTTGVGSSPLPLPLTRPRPSSTSIPVRVSSDVGRRDRERRLLPAQTQTHKHSRSAGSVPWSPLLATRTWLI